jgi:putative acetyltransferase
MIRWVEAASEIEIAHARLLFRSYAEEFASWISESLSSQGFDTEVASLPGKYAQPSGCILLAMESDEAAGCVAMRDLGGGACEMKRLFVAPQYRGQRLGRRLVEELLRRAQLRGYHRMMLDTLPEMLSAIALYQSFGFVEIAPYWASPIERTLYFEKSLSRDQVL